MKVVFSFTDLPSNDTELDLEVVDRHQPHSQLQEPRKQLRKKGGKKDKSGFEEGARMSFPVQGLSTTQTKKRKARESTCIG